MIGDAFVFDSVAHVFNFEQDNAFGQPGQMFSNHLYAFHAALTPSGETVLPPERFLHNWSVDEIDEMVFGQSDTDMLVAMPLPLTDLYKDGLSAWERCAELAARRPDRTVFWGSVNPLEGRRALDLMERQGQGLRGQGVEVYNARLDQGAPLPPRPDRPPVTLPVLPTTPEAGVKT